MEILFRYTVVFFCTFVLIGILYLSFQNAAPLSIQSQDVIKFVDVHQLNFFETTDTLPKAGEKWFNKGVLSAARGDTTQAKACYQKALKIGYPVSREHLMPVGL